MADVDVGAVAPVTNAPVAAEVATPDQVSTAEPVEKPEGAEPSAPEPEKMLTQSEVNKLIQKRERIAESRASKVARAEAERDFYRQQLEERTRTAAPPERASGGEPQVEDFKDPKEFVRAFIRWERQQEREKEEKGSRSLDSCSLAREKIFTPGRAKFADFAEVVSADDVAITDVMMHSAARLKTGVDVLYHLGQHPEESQRIAQLPDIEQAWEIKALESKLAQPPAVTKTPPPIKPLDGNAGAKRDWEDLSTAEHVEKWLKRKR